MNEINLAIQELMHLIEIILPSTKSVQFCL